MVVTLFRMIGGTRSASTWWGPTGLGALFLVDCLRVSSPLFDRNGVLNRRNSFEDGVVGTTCPISPGQNFIFAFFKLRIKFGSFYYFPSLGFHKETGGFGGIRILSIPLIPVPLILMMTALLSLEIGTKTTARFMEYISEAATIYHPLLSREDQLVLALCTYTFSPARSVYLSVLCRQMNCGKDILRGGHGCVGLANRKRNKDESNNLVSGFQMLNLQIEEDICQVLAYLWLEMQFNRGAGNNQASSSYRGKRSPFELKLGNFFNNQIESDKKFQLYMETGFR